MGPEGFEEARMEAELLPSLLQLSAYGTPLALLVAYWKLAKPISSR